ncbi:MAG: hypothetical protein GX568_03480 [Candidatus Gastranaerophilales bacterium]|nr:hypothetical protein [Candidatus Gastranaerophilales bacterium]
MVKPEDTLINRVFDHEVSKTQEKAGCKLKTRSISEKSSEKGARIP